MYKVHRPPLSQHFLTNRTALQKIVRSASISPTDTLIEIGPGTGHLTAELLTYTSNIVAVEIDRRFFPSLHARFPHLALIHQDFLDFPLPDYPYQVFSNLPFRITGDVIRKLLLATNPPEKCHLVVQREAALKFLISSRSNTMASIMYYPLFSLTISHTFARSDFFPRPSVNSCLLYIHKRPRPLIPRSQYQAYLDHVVHSFTYNSRAKFIPKKLWLDFTPSPASFGSFTKWSISQMSLQKVHRTRVNPSWTKLIPTT